MEKVVTVTLDSEALLQNITDETQVCEVNGLNAYLELGWNVTDWEILKVDDNTGRLLIWVVLNDDVYDDDDDDDFDGFDFSDPEEE